MHDSLLSQNLITHDHCNPQDRNDIKFTVKAISSHLQKITIGIPSEIVEPIYQETVELFKSRTMNGFSKDTVPSEYIEETFKDEINQKIKNYLFKYIALDFMFDEIMKQKIALSNYPRLAGINIASDKSFSMHFDISVADPINFKEWKHFSFKSPKRKRYKDLDKQVIQFLEKEAISTKKLNLETVEDNDWVFFSATLLNKDKMLLPKTFPTTMWIKVKQDEIDNPFSRLFINKNLHQSFVTNILDEEESSHGFENQGYSFLIKIQAITKGRNFVMDNFKTMFRLKNKAEIHNKMMEVFSYRNDQSQRKSILEEIFHLFLTKHRFEIPKHLTLRRQEDILIMLSQRPDYQVYKAQKNFYEHVETLAETQLKEEIMIDQIAYNENITLDLKDIHQYLQLFNNKRLKEFVYFKPLLEPIDAINTPLNYSLLKRTVMREKTLNYIIYVLTH